MHLENFHFLVLGIIVLIQAKIPENPTVTCAFVTVLFSGIFACLAKVTIVHRKM
jgi:hypothetical protein